MNKIFIIGLAGSGKTFLANKLKNRLNYPTYTTDWILYEKDTDLKRIKLSEKEYLKNIDKILAQNKWIVEGVHYFEKIALDADLILFLDTPIYKNILGIIRRYLTDKEYRKTYKLRDSLALIHKTVAGYYSTPKEELLYYPKYKGRKKYQKVLEKHRGKVKVVRNIQTYLKSPDPPPILVNNT